MARYDAIADWYDAYVTGDKARVTALAQEPLSLLGTGPGRCLDLCCGGGVHSPALRELGWDVVGLDESEEQLRIARERLPDAEFVHGDAHDLPFPDASFDAVAAIFVHTDCTRVLHPGYREEGWTREGPGIGTGIRSRVGIRHVTLATLLTAIAEAGLTIERAREPGTDDPPALLAITARR